jgi:undecaprenyl-diphosphatase
VLGVVLTPAVIAKEAYRFYQAHTGLTGTGAGDALSLIGPSLFGMGLSFLAGLAALRWLEQDRWHIFGGYCLLAAVAVLCVG